MKIAFSGDATDAALTVLERWGRSVSSSEGMRIRLTYQDDRVLYDAEISGVSWKNYGIEVLVPVPSGGRTRRSITIGDIREIYVY